ncbi:hypothetical protein WICPIJ_004971 [Wickerhamomyces pijperi]|uniref:Autophagy-related protein 2 n=1 Tax=Wickerhamomyces pijperi TaxID=599730 RepID=A0A9P8Q717_WICPI|nr:hypothetical protein WICPIJ_004971 [Wickerhamomyces pijperi]
MQHASVKLTGSLFFSTPRHLGRATLVQFNAMATQWMPQNIQKRLLLYLLSQLSLFSGIDLENINDVTLGSNSVIQLNDVELDPDALQIPGVYIRSGKVGCLKLELSVNGGVVVTCDEVNITISLANHSNVNLEGSFNSILDKSRFSLQQSTMDLANSMLQGEVEEEEEDQQQQTQSDTTETQQSTLNSVMSKAVEAALARLQVKCHDISLRLMLDHATIDCLIDEANLAVVDGVRKLDVSKIMVVGVKPSADPGETQETEDEANTSNDEVDPSTDEDDVNEDDEDDEKYASMMGSSVLKNPTNLDESLVYSKAEASSIYMSATSDVFKSGVKEFNNHPRLVFIDEIRVSFTGLSQIEDLKIEIGNINIALTPLPLTALHIIESLISLHSKSMLSTDPNSRLRVNLNKKPSNATEKPSFHSILELITVNQINLNLVSSLLPNGQFAKSKELTLSFSNIEVNFSKPAVVFGFIHQILIKQVDHNIASFEGDQTQHDFKFEYKQETSETIVLLSKSLEMTLDSDIINKVLKLSAYLDQLLASFAKLKSSSKLSSSAMPNSSKNKKSNITLQSSIITINLKLSPLQTVALRISPISYSSDIGLLDIKKISISNEAEKLLNLTNLQVRFEKEKQIKSFDNNGHDSSLLCSSFGSIDVIEFEHGLLSFKDLQRSLSEMASRLVFSLVEPGFKPRKKRTRISNSLIFQSRQTVKFFLEVNKITLQCNEITDKFGDLRLTLDSITASVGKDNYIQVHSLDANLLRVKDQLRQSAFNPINRFDKKIPVFSFRTKDFKKIDVLLRNSILEYHTNWLELFDSRSNDGNATSSEDAPCDSTDTEGKGGSKVELCFNLIEFAVGLNPGRLPSKAILVIGTGSLDVNVGSDSVTKLRSQLRQSNLVLIDDVANVTKDAQSERKSWTTLNYYQTLSFADVAKLKTISLEGEIVKGGCELNLDIDKLEVELCADSNQCLISVFNDLKLPVMISPELKYKLGRETSEVNVFQDVDMSAFNEVSIQRTEVVSDVGSDGNSINIIDEFYTDSPETNAAEESPSGSITTLTKGSNSTINNMERTHYFNDSADLRSRDLSQSLFITDDHFETVGRISTTIGRPTTEAVKPKIVHPFVIHLNAEFLSIKIFDGYDWKHTRQLISKAVKRLKELLIAKREMLNLSSINSAGSGASQQPARNESRRPSQEEIIGETLFDSIHVSFPISKDPTQIDQIIHDNINATSSGTADLRDEGIEVGKKSNLKKLRLHRSKYHKILIELEDLNLDFTLHSTTDPTLPHQTNIEDEVSEIVNELNLTVRNFEITDNVPTSTWNKFVTYKKDVEREYGSSMLTVEFKTVKPISTLAATELILAIKVLPLRLHVDQDTLEMLTRFGEFKDSRFFLIDEFEDIPFIQRFDINAVHVKLDYKPKTIDYSGLKSGRTTEFMNFFILDEADMIMKQVTLHGVSGFARLGQLLNGLWMPDIRSNQLSGVLSGLAPVRSVVNIGSGFKDLILIPMNEYKKDGRLYRSVSKGVEHFAKNTTNELVKFGVKLAAGTQTLLENTESVLGGSGSSARVISSTKLEEGVNQLIEDRNMDLDEDTNIAASQLIGKSSLSTTQFNRTSLYEPTLESISDINETDKLFKKTDHIPSQDSDSDTEDFATISEDELPRTISLYANQPTNLVDGLRLAYDSLGRNFLVMKKALIQAGIDINESNSAQDAGLIIAKTAPIALIRPAIGVTEATSKALLGINNQFDPDAGKFVEEKIASLPTSMTQISTLDPDPKSLQIPASMASLANLMASSLEMSSFHCDSKMAMAANEPDPKD